MRGLPIWMQFSPDLKHPVIVYSWEVGERGDEALKLGPEAVEKTPDGLLQSVLRLVSDRR